MILLGDALERLKEMESESVQCCVTSPPYWGLRDYGVDGQMGLEKTPEEFVAAMVEVFREVKRVLKSDGTLWLNLGDSYASSGGNTESRLSGKQKTNRGAMIGSIRSPTGMKPKDLCGIPWAMAFALRNDGWYLRQDIIWHKPNPMPESVRDRCTKAHEYIFLLSKSPKYLYNADAIREECKTKDIRRPYGSKGANELDPRGKQGDGKPRKGFHNHENDLQVGQRIDLKSNHPLGKNKRSVWTITPKPFKEAHFATFPPSLVEPCILAGSNIGDTVLDPFFGAGTTGLVAQLHGRKFIGIELNETYAEIARKRIEAAKAPA